MRQEIRTEFLNIIDFLKNYWQGLKELGPRGVNLWRRDLMRLRPDEVYDYLTAGDLKLQEAQYAGFAPALAERFFDSSSTADERRNRQEALIYVCLELDAWFRWRGLDTSAVCETQREALCKKLGLRSGL